MKSFNFLPVLPSEIARTKYSEIKIQKNYVEVLGEHQSGVRIQRRFWNGMNRFEVISKNGILVSYGQDFNLQIREYESAKLK